MRREREGEPDGKFKRGFGKLRAQDSDTLCVGRFIRGLVAQICQSGLIQGYEDKVRDPAVQSLLQPGECERNPAEAFKRCILLPLLGTKSPQQSYFVLVDSVDEGCNIAEGDQTSTTLSGTIAELLATHYEFFPPWLLLLCSARKQNKAVTKLFTGFRKISLDDLRKAYIVKDVQQYILHRLDQEEALRQHLTKETAEMLNQLHIKSSGCFLYLERVLDGVPKKDILMLCGYYWKIVLIQIMQISLDAQRCVLLQRMGTRQ
ncbi:ankyrin repeat domain-containing protein 50 [Crotalus adamanteus]|uniref:Ankyrin repeat domain-containing protein 50 n=1 Tax=Crotalus adamanteus TaxID=8729 RepID=A0AAW1BB05_CROAD